MFVKGSTVANSKYYYIMGYTFETFVLYVLTQNIHEPFLSPGNEYIIKLTPYGRVSEIAFQDLTLEQRKCRLKHEVFDGATTSIYSKRNCKYDCQVKMAIESCQCIPWDFTANDIDVEECDLFGRSCFFGKLANFTHSPVDLCLHCIDECDRMEFKREIIDVKSLKLNPKVNDQNETEYCNEYVCMDLFG